MSQPKRFRPVAPFGYEWRGTELVNEIGTGLELNHEVRLAIEAVAALAVGSPVVDDRVKVTFFVPVEEVECVN
jgi:hypothetical protein